MKVAYLVNQYPKVSHSFIRREIAALEALGARVERVSIRRTDAAELADELDRGELERTRAVLDGGARALALGLAACALTRPARALAAGALAARLGWRSDRGLLRHVVYLAEACVLLRALRAGEPDHIHAHFGTNSAAVAMLCRVLGGPPYSFTAHGPEEFDKPASLGLADKIGRAAFVAGVSSFGRSQLYRQVRRELWDRVHVVRCGLDEAFLAAEPVPIPAAPRLVCVGRLCEQKGQLLLVEAAGRLAAEGVELELVLVGDGEMRRDVEALAARLGLAERVRITGWASSDRVREELENARALVLPSFAEGLPVVIMEALALGRPVLSTYVAGIPELVVPGSSGWLVPAGSAEDLSEALRAALTAPVEELERMGRAGRERVLRLHDARGSARLLLELFQRSAA